jgi:hypothetical protein
MITNVGDLIEVAHIYPFSMSCVTDDSPRPDRFWSLLQLFWNEEHIVSWYRAIFPRGTEVVDNLMCLQPSVHRYHDKALIAFQPVALTQDKKKTYHQVMVAAAIYTLC